MLTPEEILLKTQSVSSSLRQHLYKQMKKISGQRLKPIVTHCASTLLGAVLVCTKQEQPILPGYGSENSTSQDTCPGRELHIDTLVSRGTRV